METTCGRGRGLSRSLKDIPKEEQHHIVGGEVCMWGEWGAGGMKG